LPPRGAIFQARAMVTSDKDTRNRHPMPSSKVPAGDSTSAAAPIVGTAGLEREGRLLAIEALLN